MTTQKVKGNRIKQIVLVVILIGVIVLGIGVLVLSGGGQNFRVAGKWYRLQTLPSQSPVCELTYPLSMELNWWGIYDGVASIIAGGKYSITGQNQIEFQSLGKMLPYEFTLTNNYDWRGDALIMRTKTETSCKEVRYLRSSLN